VNEPLARSDRVPDAIEPIAAYRMWVYTMRGFTPHLHPLCSTGDHEPSPWDGAESAWVTATCSSGSTDPDHVPGLSCTCGFYAVKALATLVEGPIWNMDLPAEDAIEKGRIFGRIKLAGKVIEHDRGYRAERARIDKLIPIVGDESSSTRLAALLEMPMAPPVPVIPFPLLPWLPPDPPSTPRLRIAEWVRETAA
jgi:hypothetical protein